MTAVWAAAITGFFGFLTATMTVFKDEIKAWIAGNLQPSAITTGPKLLPIESIVVKEGPVGQRKRPFDTKSQILQTESGDAYIFRLHQPDKKWFELLFMIGWLVAWTAGIIFFAFGFFELLLGMFFGSSRINAGPFGMQLFVTVFTGGWLVGAIAGEFAVAKAIKRRLATILGQIQISVSRHEIAVRSILGSLMTGKEYETLKCDGFGEVGGVVFLRYGVQRIQFEGFTSNEAEWLGQQLNNAYRTVIGETTAATPVA
jgi:hypothetical protein